MLLKPEGIVTLFVTVYWLPSPLVCSNGLFVCHSEVIAVSVEVSRFPSADRYRMSSQSPAYAVPAPWLAIVQLTVIVWPHAPVAGAVMLVTTRLGLVTLIATAATLLASSVSPWPLSKSVTSSR